MSRSKFVVNLWDIGANRGPGTLVASIPDAKDIGVASYANDQGEAFFTLPWNHPQISQIQPLLRHYQVLRWNGASYDTMGVGLLDDLTADKDEVIAYGSDYMGLFTGYITPAAKSYASQFIGTILTERFSATINDPNSRLGFLTTGTIDTTSKTTIALTSYQEEMQFFQGLLDILTDGNSTRPLISITRSSPFTLSFNQNAGSLLTKPRLEFGKLINDFSYQPDYRSLVTRVYAIGQKRDGATILYSNQSYASVSTYGLIQTSRVFIDIVDQTALDNKTRSVARQLARIPKGIAIATRNGALVPGVSFDLMDSLPVVINRGIVNVNVNMTHWGYEWTGRRNGSEDLFLDLRPMET